MEMIEQNLNIFESNFKLVDDFYYINFLSKDRLLSDTVSEKFNKKFNIINGISNINLLRYDALLIGKVFTLFVRDKATDIMSESLLLNSLIKMKEICNNDGIKELHFTKLNCNSLIEFYKIKSAINSIFNDTEIKIIAFAF